VNFTSELAFALLGVKLLIEECGLTSGVNFLKASAVSTDDFFLIG
jgi:hypothetical protein